MVRWPEDAEAAHGGGPDSELHVQFGETNERVLYGHARHPVKCHTKTRDHDLRLEYHKLVQAGCSGTRLADSRHEHNGWPVARPTVRIGYSGVMKIMASSRAFSSGELIAAHGRACLMTAGSLTWALDDGNGEGRFMPNFGKLVDKAKKLAGKHPDQVNKGVDKAEHVAEEKTGGKYGSQIQDAGNRAEGYLGTQGQGTPGQGTGNQ